MLIKLFLLNVNLYYIVSLIDFNGLRVFFGYGVDLGFGFSVQDNDFFLVCFYVSVTFVFIFIEFDLNFSLSLLKTNIDTFDTMCFGEDLSEKSYAFVRTKVC